MQAQLNDSETRTDVAAYRWVVAGTALLVLAQAVLAGRGWFRDYDLIEVHGWVGNATFLAVLAQLALAWMARGALGRLPLAVAILLTILVAAQFGLGYGGRESAEAAAWHVPNGVLIFGLASAAAALAWAPRTGVTGEGR